MAKLVEVDLRKPADRSCVGVRGVKLERERGWMPRDSRNGHSLGMSLRALDAVHAARLECGRGEWSLNAVVVKGIQQVFVDKRRWRLAGGS